ncbi:MAG: amidohydrolase family protein [Planctomycetota bacterium]
MKIFAHQSLVAGAVLLAALSFSVPASSAALPPQEEGGEGAAGGEEGGKDEEKGAEDDAEKAGDEYFAILGGDIYTGTGAILRGATLLARNGTIKEIGYDVFLPEKTTKLDARGMRVYPGLVALNATPRITGGLFGAAPDVGDGPDLDAPTPCPCGGDLADGANHTDHWDPIFADPAYADDAPPTAVDQARIKAEDAYDPYSEFMLLALATGITTAEQSNLAMKLRRGAFKGTFMGEKSMTSVSWSRRNPSSITSTKEKFAAAAKYLREYREWEARGDKEAKEPSKRGVDTSVLRILKGETLARFNATERDDLLAIAGLAQTYGFRPVIVGAHEGWAVAEELGRAGAYAILTPRDRRPKDEALVRAGGTSIENAAVLHASGVQVAVIPPSNSFDLGGITGRDLMHLPIEAGFAVRGGLPETAALQSITIVPARLLGVSHRIGTLEVGKDCDAIVADGDVLHYQTFVQYAVVLGKVCYDKQKEIFYAHIRPRPELPPLDPGEAPESVTPPAEEAGPPPAAEEGVEADEEKEGEEGSGDSGSGG